MAGLFEYNRIKQVRLYPGRMKKTKTNTLQGKRLFRKQLPRGLKKYLRNKLKPKNRGKIMAFHREKIRNKSRLGFLFPRFVQLFGQKTFTVTFQGRLIFIYTEILNNIVFPQFVINKDHRYYHRPDQNKPGKPYGKYLLYISQYTLC